MKPAESIESLTENPSETSPVFNAHARNEIVSLALEAVESGMKSKVFPTRQVSLKEWEELNETLTERVKTFVRFPDEDEVLELISNNPGDVRISMLDFRPSDSPVSSLEYLLLLDDEALEEVVSDYCERAEEILSNSVRPQRFEIQRLLETVSNGSREKLFPKVDSYRKRLSLESMVFIQWLESNLIDSSEEKITDIEYDLLLKVMACNVAMMDYSDRITGNKDNTYIKTTTVDILTSHVLDLMQDVGINSQELESFWTKISKFVPDHESMMFELDSLRRGTTSEAVSYMLILGCIPDGMVARLSVAEEDIRGTDIIVENDNGHIFTNIDIKKGTNYPNPIVFTLVYVNGKMLKLEDGSLTEFPPSAKETYEITNGLLNSVRKGIPGTVLRLSSSIGTENHDPYEEAVLKKRIVLQFKDLEEIGDEKKVH